MKDGKIPNPNTINPIAGYDKEIYIKPTIKNKNIKPIYENPKFILIFLTNCNLSIYSFLCSYKI